MATTVVVGPGTYTNASGTSAAWQPPACTSVTVTLAQVNTSRAGQTATLSGNFLASQDGSTYVDAGDFSAEFAFVDTTVVNAKTGVLQVPPDAVFGTPYAPFIKVLYSLAGKITTQGITLATN